MKFYKFHTIPESTNQWAYCTEARAKRYCADMHGHQSLTHWHFSAATPDEIKRMGLKGREREFLLN